MIVKAEKQRPSPWIFDLLLLVVLLAGAFLRVTGIFWGEDTYLHPDERFLLMVGSSITPVKSPFAACEKARLLADGQAGDQGEWINLREYFDTANSPLNPNNCGHGLYVYGTFPMFLTRFAVEWIYGHSGLTEMLQVGRPLSALADLLTVFLVYMIASRLYDRRVGLLAAAFSAFAVLQIQQAHFFTMDTFVNLFSLLAFYFGVRILVDQRAWGTVTVRETVESGYREEVPSGSYGITHQHNQSFNRLTGFVRHPLFWNSLGFGLAFGLAMASKVNALPLAVVLPAAVFLRMWRLPSSERDKQLLNAVLYLVMAGLASFLVFRILQPYAFSGPGFFGLSLNPQWVANLRELRMLTSGDVDFPPAMQWARRPLWFSAQNLVLWGLGLPLGLLAFAGFLWTGWQILSRQGNWQRHLLIWGWTGLYFGWQSLSSNPTMRYQLLIYPQLAIFAAWAVFALYDRRRRWKSDLPAEEAEPRRWSWSQVSAILIGGFVLLATFVWAFAFTTTVYGQPFTRAAASRWIYQNIPGPINLHIQMEEGGYNQPLPFPYSATILPGTPYNAAFTPNKSGEISEIYIPHLVDEQGGSAARTLTLSVSAQPGGDQALGTAALTGDLPDQAVPREPGYTFQFDPPISLTAGQTYYLQINLQGEPQALEFSGPMDLLISTPNAQGPGNPVTSSLDIPGFLLRPGMPYATDFISDWDGTLNGLYLSGLTLPEAMNEQVSLQVRAIVPGEGAAFDSSAPATDLNDAAILVADVPVYLNEINQGGLLIPFDMPIPLIPGQNYTLLFNLNGGSGLVKLQGAAIANEGEWDDPLPVRIDGYDAYGGIYPLDLNLNMYWDDNPEKLARFQRILDQSEYLVISSSRQWGSLPRIPERFPMTTTYYRNLIGCPVEYTIESCYNVAEPGTFQGNLGYELIQVFDANPSVGPLEINDQPSEEAFTVYDHPKVFVFRKTADYDPQKVAGILGAVDFSQIIRMPPLRYGSQPANLMLPVDRLAEQRQNGTWSQLFNTQALQNRFPAISAVLWYLSVFALGLMAYPMLRWLLPGLSDHGYPLARTAGMLILAYGVWLAGSLRIPFSRLTITLAIALLAILAGYLAYRQRGDLRREWRSRKRYFLTIESLFLAFFILDLLIRMGNPDLWHPWKGGEKPMDFAYFNAVLKSNTFPPYDPWFAGGYLNYYYFGFVFAGVLVKWLGIVPAVAYNLIIPTIFAMIALGAFSLAWNLTARFLVDSGDGSEGERRRLRLIPLFSGLAGALGMAFLGNLGTVKMIYEGYKRLGAPGGVTDTGGVLTHWVWAIRGFVQVLAGNQLPYSLGDWYWLPSRAIPAPNDVEPITEFPFFTVLYADLHAHLFAMPIALLALGWVLSLVFSRGRWRSLSAGLFSFLLGGIIIGALRPTNTWDFYPYLALAAVGIGYALWFRRSDGSGARFKFLENIPESSRRILRIAGGAALLIGLSFVLYQPYAEWYGLGYGQVELWHGTRTPLMAYLTHWGLFLFVIISWMIWETREWMANTPVSALRKLQPYQAWIWTAAALLLLLTAGLLILGAGIAWFVLPLAAWAGLLLMRPDQTDAKRFVLFLVGTGLVLTLMVEVIVLRGDIGRMNTVFKFYLQVWTFFAISAAAAFGWLLIALPRWLPSWRSAFQVGLTILVAGAALFPLLGGVAKIKDRMITDGLVTLDGMAYMQTAQYADTWGTMDLGQDYQAIRWMQENVQGSPVIVEANLRDLYRWGSRFSNYTGLPGVVGWEWHQQQQRAVVPGTWISSRIAEIETFYTTTDLGEAAAFLRKYDVEYIIVGQQERGKYPGPGLDKFPAAEGSLWREVYRQGDTVIYKVIRENLS